ncbi:MAG: thioredoxin family protein [Candidatus Neomarinimicrobiota bacterium]
MFRPVLIPVVAIMMVAGLHGKELRLGEKIPLADLEMLDVSGQGISLGDVEGSEGLVVIFSCNTCPWVTAWEGRYVELAGTYKDRGFGFIAVNSNETYREKGDGYADMQQQAQDNGYNFNYVVDEKSRLAKAFGATRTPHVFIFNGAGRLVYRGAIDDNAYEPEKVEKAYTANALEAILADRAPEEASTKAIGCSIKAAPED